MKQENKNEQAKKNSIIQRKIIAAIKIGFWGALIWGGIGYLVYWFNLVKLSPSHISRLFLKSNLIFQWQGIITSFAMLICISILLSLIYVFLFSHIYTPWIGIILGGFVWYIMLGWRKLDMITISSTASLFILYGAFIGYSLSMEFSSLEKK